MGLMSVSDYKNFLSTLFPRGAAWNLFQGFDLKKVIDSFATEMERVDARALELIEQSDPRTTTELLTDYERLLGLPEANQVLGSTEAIRRGDVVGKMASYGGQSNFYFIDLALKMGIVITIQEYREFKAGQSRSGDLLTNGDWVYAFKVITDPYISSENLDRIRKVINKLKPAHTNAIFTETAIKFYSGVNNSGDPLQTFT